MLAHTGTETRGKQQRGYIVVARVLQVIINEPIHPTLTWQPRELESAMLLCAKGMYNYLTWNGLRPISAEHSREAPPYGLWWPTGVTPSCPVELLRRRTLAKPDFDRIDRLGFRRLDLKTVWLGLLNALLAYHDATIEDQPWVGSGTAVNAGCDVRVTEPRVRGLASILLALYHASLVPTVCPVLIPHKQDAFDVVRFSHRYWGDHCRRLIAESHLQRRVGTGYVWDPVDDWSERPYCLALTYVRNKEASSRMALRIMLAWFTGNPENAIFDAAPIRADSSILESNHMLDLLVKVMMFWRRGAPDDVTMRVAGLLLSSSPGKTRGVQSSPAWPSAVGSVFQHHQQGPRHEVRVRLGTERLNEAQDSQKNSNQGCLVTVTLTTRRIDCMI